MSRYNNNCVFFKFTLRFIFLNLLAIMVGSCDNPPELKFDNPSDPLSTNPIPLPPTNVTLKSLSKSSYQLSWQGQSSFETGYLIERYPGRRSADIPDTTYTKQPTLIEEGIDSSIYYYQIHAMAQSRIGRPTAKITVIYSEGLIYSLPNGHAGTKIFDPKGNFIVDFEPNTIYLDPFSNYKLLNSSNDSIDIEDGISSFSISPQGDLLAVGTEGIYRHTRLMIWKILNHSLQSEFSMGEFNYIFFSPDSKSIVPFYNRSYIEEIYDVKSGTVQHTIGAMGEFVFMTYTPDGQFLITLSSDNKISYFNTGNNYIPSKRYSCPPGGQNLDVSSDGQILAGKFNSTFLFWHTNDTLISSKLSLFEPTYAMHFIPGTHKLTVANGNGILIIDADDAHIERTINTGISFRTYAVSPNGKYFALSGSTCFWSAGDSWWIVPL